MNKNIYIVLGIVIGILLIIVSAMSIVSSESFLVICKTFGYDPGDFLSYFGALIGGAMTLIGVVLTILATNYQMKQERIISAKPWIISRTKLISSKQDLEEIICDKPYYVRLKFNREQKTIDSSYVSEKITDRLLNKNYIFNQNECLVRVVLKNIGGNSATHFTVMIDNFIVFPELGLGVNDELSFVFNLPIKPWDNESSWYEMNLTFSDVFSGNIYQQIERFNIKQDGKGVTFGQNQVDALSSPILLKNGGSK